MPGWDNLSPYDFSIECCKNSDFKSNAIDPNNPSVYEPEAAYLERLELLMLTEKKYLKQHPELLRPDKIEFEGENFMMPNKKTQYFRLSESTWGERPKDFYRDAKLEW